MDVSDSVEDSNVHDEVGAERNIVVNVDEIPVNGYNLRSKRQNAVISETNCALVADFEEPRNYQEAMNSDVNMQWKTAMNEEYDSLINNGTWSLEELPVGKKAISNKWVYKIKRNQDGNIERYKARLVVRGFTQKEGLDYEETFSPVAKFTSIRTILALSTSLNYSLIQFDTKTAFLYGQLEDEI